MPGWGGKKSIWLVNNMLLMAYWKVSESCTVALRAQSSATFKKNKHMLIDKTQANIFHQFENTKNAVN